MTSDVAGKWTHQSPGSVATDSSLAQTGLITNSFLRLGLPSHSCMEKLCGKGVFHFLRLPITLTTEIGRPQRLKLQPTQLAALKKIASTTIRSWSSTMVCLSVCLVWNRLQAQTRRHNPESFHTASGRELSICTYKVIPLWNSLVIIHRYILYTPESSAQNATTGTYQHTLRYNPDWKAFIFNLHKENITLLAANAKTNFNQETSHQP